MISIRFELDKKQLRGVERDLKKLNSRMPKILSRAADKTATSARVSLAKEMQGTYTEKSAKLKKNIEIQKASHSNPIAVIKVTGKPQPAIYFHHSKGGKGGAKLQILKERPFDAVISKKKEGDTEEPRKAFLAQMPSGHNAQVQSGHKGIFQRVAGEYMDKSPRLSKPNVKPNTKHTERIKELLSPSPVKMAKKIYGDNGLLERTKPEMERLFQKYLEQQIGLVFHKKKKGGA